MAPEAAANGFAGKKALVTGSGRGIGRAIALEFARRGADVILHCRRDTAAAEKTQTEIQGFGVKAWLYRADFCDTAETRAFLETVARDHDTLDFFVANAASTSFKALAELSEANIRKTFDVVITSFLLCVQALTPLMKNRGARLLAISGIDTRRFCPGHGLLAAAKAALETLVKYLSVELAAEGIAATCLNPGLVATDSTRFYLGAAFDGICGEAGALAPRGGVATPEKAAKLALALMHPDCDWIGGETVVADGGLSFLLPALAR